ncbi:MAG: branched-chain amino acid ABC transporter permease [Candidatus Hodarchaeota archaeon]
MSSILQRLWGWLAIIFVLTTVPLVIKDSYILSLLIFSLLYAVLAASWDLTLGYSGVFNFGHMAFFGIGAYSSAISVITFDISPLLGILIGGSFATASGSIIGLLTLRLRGIYVALLTFAFAEICHYSAYGLRSLTGGSSGLVGLPTFQFRGVPYYKFGEVAYYYGAVFLFIVFVFLFSFLLKSKLGLSVIALRDAESYAISRGISRTRQRIIVFLFSAFAAGSIGSFYAHYVRFVAPDLFEMGYLMNALSMVIVGGAGTLRGPIIAAFLLTFMLEFMQELGAWRFLVMSGLMILVIIYMPRGLYSILEYSQTYAQKIVSNIAARKEISWR